MIASIGPGMFSLIAAISSGVAPSVTQAKKDTYSLERGPGDVVLAMVVPGQLVVEVRPGGRELFGPSPIASGERVQRVEEPGEVPAKSTVDRLVHAHLGHEPTLSASVPGASGNPAPRPTAPDGGHAIRGGWEKSPDGRARSTTSTLSTRGSAPRTASRGGRDLP
jgi:hypothetical protein